MYIKQLRAGRAMVIDIWSPACKHWPAVLSNMATKAESADLSNVVFVTINTGNVADAVRLITEQDLNMAHSRVSMYPLFALLSTQNIHWVPVVYIYARL